VAKTFADTENNICSDCNAAVGCDSCQGKADFCTSCISPKLLFNNTCVDSCVSKKKKEGKSMFKINFFFFEFFFFYNFGIYNFFNIKLSISI
jgi:hypothetical protein